MRRGSTPESSSSTEPGRYPVGRLGRPHGLDGYLGLYIDDEDTAGIGPGSSVFVDDRELMVRALRRADRGYQIAFEGVDDRDGAEEIRGKDVAVATRRRLGDDEFWPEDLIGLAVRNGDGSPLGVVVDVIFGAAQERLVVESPSGSRFEIPFVTELVPVVDVAAGVVEVVDLPGLIEP